MEEIRGKLTAAGEADPDSKIRVLFATHSIPTRDAEAAGRSEDEPREFAEGSAYAAQHLANAKAIMDVVAPNVAWDLVYQSRSGAPHIPVA